MDDNKWEFGTYFASNQDFKDGIRTYSIDNARNLKFKKNDKTRMIFKKILSMGGILCKN